VGGGGCGHLTKDRLLSLSSGVQKNKTSFFFVRNADVFFSGHLTIKCPEKNPPWFFFWNADGFFWYRCIYLHTMREGGGLERRAEHRGMGTREKRFFFQGIKKMDFYYRISSPMLMASEIYKRKKSFLLTTKGPKKLESKEISTLAPNTTRNQTRRVYASVTKKTPLGVGVTETARFEPGREFARSEYSYFRTNLEAQS